MKVSGLIASATLWLGLALSASAADLVMAPEPDAPSCTLAADDTLNDISDMATLKQEVTLRMDAGVAAAKDPQWVASRRPVFLWANETKTACGIAYGYLKSGYRDTDSIGACGCFHSRMVGYMN